MNETITIDQIANDVNKVAYAEGFNQVLQQQREILGK